MKFSRVAIMIALKSALSAGTIFAQSGVQQPGSTQPTTYDNYGNYGSYYAQDDVASPSDLQTHAPEPEPASVYEESSCGCQSVAGCSRCRPALCCIDDCPWRLFPCHNEGGWFLNGWINAGYTANGDSPGSNWNGPVAFNDRDEFMMNQLYLTGGREAYNGGCGWALGGQIDLLYGTDARYVAANGLERDDDNVLDWRSGRFYGLAMPQAYLEVAYNDLSVKFGHFYSITGYETIPAAGNFFYSHAYTLVYGEPFTLTGALASYRVSDRTTILGGVHRGWNNWEAFDNSDTIHGVGGFTWTNCCGLSIAWSGTIGREQGAVVAGNQIYGERYLSSLVISQQFSDRLTYVFQNDIARQGDAVDDGDRAAEWYGINQYLFYKLNCCWTAGARFEWFRDDDGFRVAGRGDNFGLGDPSGVGGFAGNFYNITLGLNWTPNANLIVRPELRYDWFDGAGDPYNDLNDDNQFTAAIDAIYRY